MHDDSNQNGATDLAQREDAEAIAALEANLCGVIRGKPRSVRLLVIALLAGGHALLEDVPGTGKTTLAKCLARSIDGEFRRVQFTPDLLPSDIIGSSYYRPNDGTFEFRDGPIFTNILLADEINRTSPRTQSALLEVMSENQVSVEGRRRALALPFMVVATQNPAEFQGTYPLPEAQLDRFALRIELGYPDHESELKILADQQSQNPFDELRAVINCKRVIGLQARVRRLRVDASIADYIVRLVAASRVDDRLRLGISPRGSLTLYRAAQALALISGRTFVIPDDVRTLASAVLAHRIVLDNKSRHGGATADSVIQDALDSTAVPR